MPRVSELSAEGLDEAAQAIYRRYATDYGPFENQARIFAHRPPALRHIMGLLLELADEAVLAKRYLEIVLVPPIDTGKGTFPCHPAALERAGCGSAV